MVDGCLLPPAPLPVDMSNGVAGPIDDEFPVVLLVGGTGDPVVPGVPNGVANDEAVAEGIANDIPRSAAIGCQGLRADRFSSLPVILAFRSDLDNVVHL
jgi:hypothetical protein